jgi:hypothetical protein
MKQIITGPFGRVIYHDATGASAGQYPALNMPCRAFARGDTMVAANAHGAPPVVGLPRRTRSREALAMFGEPVAREIQP